MGASIHSIMENTVDFVSW